MSTHKPSIGPVVLEIASCIMRNNQSVALPGSSQVDKPPYWEDQIEEVNEEKLRKIERKYRKTMKCSFLAPPKVESVAKPLQPVWQVLTLLGPHNTVPVLMYSDVSFSCVSVLFLPEGSNNLILKCWENRQIVNSVSVNGINTYIVWDCSEIQFGLNLI